MSTPTTRRHPRTMHEAFNDADRARSVEIYRRPMSGIADVIAAVVFGVLIGVGLIHLVAR
jgi:F0F1-type ATP synthase assembly protein I